MGKWGGSLVGAWYIWEWAPGAAEIQVVLPILLACLVIFILLAIAKCEVMSIDHLQKWCCLWIRLRRRRCRVVHSRPRIIRDLHNLGDHRQSKQIWVSPRKVFPLCGFPGTLVVQTAVSSWPEIRQSVQGSISSPSKHCLGFAMLPLFIRLVVPGSLSWLKLIRHSQYWMNHKPRRGCKSKCIPEDIQIPRV